jgi:sugar lactone lactonase YvrE
VGTTVGLLKSRLAGGKPVCALLAAALLAGVLGAVEAVHLPKAAASSPITYVSNTISDPTALAFDASGDLFIANGNDDTVSVLPKASGTLFGVPVTANQLSTVASGLSYPTALAFDASGDLFIANWNNNTVSVLAKASGSIFGVPVTADQLATVITSGLSDPTALAFDASGDLFIANTGNDTVLVLPRVGGTIFGTSVVADQFSIVASGLSGPVGLAFDASGDLFIANLENDTVSELISPPPTTTPPTTAPPTTTPSTTVPTGGPGPSKPGYIVVTPKGGVSSFGAVPNLGSLVSENITPASPIVGDALTSMCPASPWL